MALAEMGKAIGAGLACTALLGAAIGVGNVFGSYLEGAMRNPSAAAGQTGNLFVGAALAEAAGLFGLVVALLLLFVF
ncbi:MAG: F0F1 ATP synthase subunit C [Alphaproteobacteria bacterium]|nr:F0F1 ATP synthase subunit C [Alphaproteobacteria bacterium]